MDRYASGAHVGEIEQIERTLAAGDAGSVQEIGAQPQEYVRLCFGGFGLPALRAQLEELGREGRLT